MIRTAAVVLTVLAVLTVLTPIFAEGRWPFWEAVDSASYQLYVKDFGSLSAICSSGAYWTDGKRTRLLTAGHCAVDDGVRYAISRDGLTFAEATVIYRGWKKKEGSVLTWRFVLSGPPQVRPAQYGSDIDARAGDFAILEVAGALKTMPLGSNKDLQLGDLLFSIGFPIGGPKIAAPGIVGNPIYDAPGTAWDRYIGMNVPGKPGSSGTPMLDESGQIVGILVAGAGDNLHLATPIDLVRLKVPCLDQPVCAYFKP